MHPTLLRIFPFLRWPRPTGETLRHDFFAGVSVGLVLIPQSLAYAALAGMPPQTGLYAALLPAIVGILWGSSALLAVGPVALTSILVFGALSAMSTPFSPDWVMLAIWLSIYAGMIQFLLGALKLGKITYLVSQPVVTGFIQAAALIIILSQLPHLTGIYLTDGNWRDAMDELLYPKVRTAMTIVFGVTSLFLLILLKRFVPRVPGIIVVTVIAIVVSRAVDYAGHGGKVVGELIPGLPSLSLPSSISFRSHMDLLPAAIIVALISFTEAMSSCRVLARKQRSRWDENQELIGQGLAKITSGLTGAFPVSGSFSRSALNLYAGAVSGWATLFATGCVLSCLLFFTGLIRDLPYSVLAASIMVPVFTLIDIGALRRIFRISLDDGIVAVVTILVTLAFSPRLHVGVFAGVSLTMVFFLYRRAHPRLIEVSLHEDGTLRDRNRFNLPPLADDVLAVRLDSAMNFLTSTDLEHFITDRCQSNSKIRYVLICASGINDIDASGTETLEALYSTLKSEGISLYMSAVKKQVWDVIERANLIAMMGKHSFFSTDREAVEKIKIVQ